MFLKLLNIFFFVREHLLYAFHFSPTLDKKCIFPCTTSIMLQCISVVIFTRTTGNTFSLLILFRRVHGCTHLLLYQLDIILFVSLIFKIKTHTYTVVPQEQTTLIKRWIIPLLYPQVESRVAMSKYVCSSQKAKYITYTTIQNYFCSRYIIHNTYKLL